MKLLTLLAAWCIVFIANENVKDAVGETKESIAKYLNRFGYNVGTFNDRNVKKALKKFQYFAGVIITGQMDDATRHMMSQPRCGDKDPDVSGGIFDKGVRKRRYNKQGSRWMKNTLSWRYDHKPTYRQYGEGLITKDKVIETIKAAMALWEKVTNIKFAEENSNPIPDIWLRFVSDRHGCNPLPGRNEQPDAFPFDGRGGVLAHAFYPLNNKGCAGDVHFDDAETFSLGQQSRDDTRDLMWVVTHELGHSLGLEHSHVQSAVMYPWYSGYKKNLGLQYDDILGIQMIYGRKIKKPVPVEPPNPPTPLPKYKICPSSPVTAIWYSSNYKRYFFITQNENLYSIKNGKLHDGPILAKNYFPKSVIGDSNKVDSVLQLGDKNIVFAGNQYIEYRDFARRSNTNTFSGLGTWNVGQRRCRQRQYGANGVFPPWANKVTASMKWQKNGKVYFFVGSWYWKYDEETKRFACGYPKPVQRGWRGLPSRPINAAHSSKGGTFFIIGNLIYRYNDIAINVQSGYPKEIHNDLFKCDGYQAGFAKVATPEPIIFPPVPPPAKGCKPKPDPREHGGRHKHGGGHKHGGRQNQSGRKKHGGRHKHRGPAKFHRRGGHDRKPSHGHGHGQGRTDEEETVDYETEEECEEDDNGGGDFPEP